MRSTGPILACGAITLGNKTLLNGQPMDWKIPIMTGVAAGVFALLEHGWEQGAVSLSYLALLAVLFVRVDPAAPAPVESFMKWLNGG